DPPDAARAEHPHAGRTWRTPTAVTARAAGFGRRARPRRDRFAAGEGAPAGARARGGTSWGAAVRRTVPGPARGRVGRERGWRLRGSRHCRSALAGVGGWGGVVLAAIPVAARRHPGRRSAAGRAPDRRAFGASQQRGALPGGPCGGVDGAAVG